MDKRYMFMENTKKVDRAMAKELPGCIKMFMKPSTTDKTVADKNKPVKEEIKKPASEYTQTLLVKCPLSGGDLHCWHCSRCHKMESCPAIPGHLQQKVKDYIKRDKPQSLHWVEGRLPHENNTLPAWEDICPDYWEGCFDCQSYKPASISYGFCSKYNREGKLLS